MEMKQFFSKLTLLVIMWGISVTLSACGSTNNTLGDDIRDYESEVEFETALNNGTNINGSTVVAKATTIAPDSKFGFNVQAGEHLNFIVTENSDIKEGSYYKFKVNSTQSFLGSWILDSDYLGEVENQTMDRTIEEVLENEEQSVINEDVDISEEEITEEEIPGEEIAEVEEIAEDDVTENEDVVVGTFAAETTSNNEEVGTTAVEKPATTQTVDASIATNYETTYVLNTSTKKFHYPGCSSVKTMKEKNKKEVTWPREEIIAAGYDSCGNCHP